LELICYLEVALRNTINSQLSRSDELHWLFALEASTDQRGRQSRAAILKAKGRLEQNSKPVSVEQIISELPFGFWVSLVSKRYRHLWPKMQPALGA
jgi:hypothetical protein